MFYISVFILSIRKGEAPIKLDDLLELNDMTTTTKRICIVHDRKFLSKFHGTINQLRQLNQFNLSALQQLPKRCCSCQNQTGESLFTIDHLRELCQQIQSEKSFPPVKFTPVKAIHYMTLEYSPLLTSLQRRYKVGRFIGRNGQHIQLIQQSLNIRIDILNTNSSKTFRQIIQKLQAKSDENHINNLWLLITMKNENDNIEKVKQSLENTWKQIDVTTRKRRSAKSQSSTTIMTFPVDTSLDGDTRWKPVKQKKRGKYKTKENLSQELEEIQPQPFVKPISMPKEISKYRKTKGK